MKLQDVILHGDVYSCLKSLNDNSISVAITSPPYWKQRDYGFKSQIDQEERLNSIVTKVVKGVNNQNDIQTSIHNQSRY